MSLLENNALGILWKVKGLISWLITLVVTFTAWLVSALGYPGIVIAMAMESACIPLPSEVIMPLAGFLISEGKMDFFGIHNDYVNLLFAALAGAIGCLLGSWAAYGVGAKGGRPLIERWGRYILISKHDLDFIDNIFNRYGTITVLGSRMLPVIRTFISLPAGIARMDLKKFTAYTLLGSYPWCLLLAGVGYILGKNWERVGTWLHDLDILIVGICAVIGIYILYRKRREIRVWFYLVFRRRDIVKEKEMKKKRSRAKDKKRIFNKDNVP